MDPIDEILEDARARGIRPWIGLKERLARRVIEVARARGGVTLQGGAALHFVYGSPRLSADVDFVGEAAGRRIADLGEELASAAGDLLGRPCRWSIRQSGRLVRGKIQVDIDEARRLVLPVEAFEVPAHRPRAEPPAGTVEEPDEILADKAVASADRLARRGTLKTTDLYDLWYLRTRLDVREVDRRLVQAKMADYGLERHGQDLGAAVRAISPEELRSALTGVLPTAELEGLDAPGVIEAAASMLEALRDVL
ncbi:MAG: nucleotidyl transferase AbiEii/AbiGii toxin family protein [Deltaproteobacteria bacterium]|nr:nucleotidyl transferase AbiEii/AbiGii toxin family protein [Deltaproteobacteria bacterium]